MQEVSFERVVRAEPSRVLQRVEKWLSANGYEVSARSNLELNLIGATTGGRHRLTVRADGTNVRFGFVPGAPGVTLPPAAELERRVDASLQDLGGPAAAPPMGAKAASSPNRRCSICATPLAAGEQNCPTCGMKQP